MPRASWSPSGHSLVSPPIVTWQVPPMPTVSTAARSASSESSMRMRAAGPRPISTRPMPRRCTAPASGPPATRTSTTPAGSPGRQPAGS
ncbi:hypothetical protein VSR01_14830 [Actinacidiphila sp. DG2A-62]|uniref:hypothetical protein n=1 Tax=Actinacidiphila sp. DG2A-62 TaxID=3108821 RepID=UPI002DB79CAB|nr:hypothetical protein [Actinacidiphila sp. DG2A-62]MEC3994732.1 hypothetical protein [Actinacidiphila sp. DG2A-62]